jgi:CapZ-interacting protein
MSILDDAIREHLELKRQHGADEAEVKRLEDEAFGPPGRPEEPDPMAEAPTEFMATSGAAEAAGGEELEGGRRINVADLQEAPPPAAPAEDPVQAAPPAEEDPLEVLDEEQALEHDAAVEPPEPGHSTEERHAIAEQPTEMFDIEAEMGTEDAPATEAPSPSDEEIVEAEAAEPRLAPVEPATEIHAIRTEAPEEAAADEEEEDDDFWSEQRLSDELDQALEAPLSEEPAADEEPAEPISEEQEQPAPRAAEPTQAEPEQQTDYDPDTGQEDVLEGTPEFLEDAPEDDELWFEQKPPKDFDFDD